MPEKFVVEFITDFRQLQKAPERLKRLQKEITAEEKRAEREKASEQRKRQQTQIDYWMSYRRQMKQAHVEEMRLMRQRQQEEKKQERDRLAAVRSQQRYAATHGLRGFMGGFMPGTFGPGAQRPFAMRAGGFVRGASLTAAGGFLGFMLSGLTRAYNTLQQYRQILGGTIGLGGGRAIAGGLRGAPGVSLGFSPLETAAQMPAMARATGVLGPRELQQGMRATGMAATEVADIFATIRQGGTRFTGAGSGRQSMGGREFVRLMSGAVQSGLEHARTPEFLKGIQRLMLAAQASSPYAVKGSALAPMLSVLGQTGLPGFQGMAGVNVLQRLQRGVVQPGGGEFGAAFMRQAFGFGVPGGTATFFGAERAREKVQSDPRGLIQVMRHLQATTGGGEPASFMLRELTGVSLQQADELQKIFTSGMSMDEKMKAIKEKLDEAAPLEKQSLKAMQGIQGGVRILASRVAKDIQAIGPIAKDIDAVINKSRDVLVDIAKGIKKVIEWVKKTYEWFAGPSAAEKVAQDIEKSTALQMDALGLQPKAKAAKLKKAQEAQIGAVQTAAEMRAAAAAMPLGPFLASGAQQAVRRAEVEATLAAPARRFAMPLAEKLSDPIAQRALMEAAAAVAAKHGVPFTRAGLESPRFIDAIKGLENSLDRNSKELQDADFVGLRQRMMRGIGEAAVRRGARK